MNERVRHQRSGAQPRQGAAPVERGGRLPVAMVFPGPAALALSTLGWQAVYRMLEPGQGYAPERFFLDDSGKLTPGSGIRPLSQEFGSPLSDFPLIAISLNWEEEYLPILQALAAGGVSARRQDRPDWPIILAGGPLSWINPAPLTPCADVFFIGEAESGFDHVLATVRDGYLAGKNKSAVVSELAQLPGVYVPGISSVPVRRVLAADGDRTLATPAASCFVSGQAQFKDMMLLEINRGCPYGCRFCAAGFVYRPPRHARLEDLKAKVEAENPKKVGLVGTALTDWPELPEFLSWLSGRNVKYSLSSLRADGLTDDLLETLRRHGVRTITLALEAPSRRLRVAANKRLAEEDFLAAVTRCAAHGVNKLKMYCIVGWPGETRADYDELGDFLLQIDEARAAGRGGPKKTGKSGKAKALELITLSLSPLVPKPFTPLQWAPMAAEADLAASIARVRELTKPIKGMKMDYMGVWSSRLQGYLARAGEEAFELALRAAELGGWKKAVKETRWDFGPVLDRERAEDEPFPWEVVAPGVSRAYLWREWQRYRQGAVTPVCPSAARGGCSACKGCGQQTG